MAEVIPAVLVDSVIMIDHFNGIPAATQYLLEMQGQLAISVITRAEVLRGLGVKNGNSPAVC
jgi:predicted nucleic acid-binding protein